MKTDKRLPPWSLKAVGSIVLLVATAACGASQAYPRPLGRRRRRGRRSMSN